jgi:hypothetical protein
MCGKTPSYTHPKKAKPAKKAGKTVVETSSRNVPIIFMELIKQENKTARCIEIIRKSSETK